MRTDVVVDRVVIIGTVGTDRTFPTDDHVLVLVPANGVFVMQTYEAKGHAVYIHSGRVARSQALLIFEHPHQMGDVDVGHAGQLPTSLHRHGLSEIVELGYGVPVVVPGLVVQLQTLVVEISDVGSSCRFC